MSFSVDVRIHQSQFPAQVRRDLMESLRSRRINHKFHYDSIKQTNKWLALHQAYSPSRNDADCAATYDRAFTGVVTRIRARSVQVVGLGCGGGQKDTRLLKLLKARGKGISYTPSDVSVAMTLVANAAASSVVPRGKSFPLVCDLATADNLSRVLFEHYAPGAARLFTFFGMIPNFEPQDILPKLAELARRRDTLLFSANLAPGADYAAGVARILPQYDNQLTRDWLLAFLFDLGVRWADGELRVSIERGADALLRVVARFHFKRPRVVQVDGREFSYQRGDNIRLFFSYRYTPDLMRTLLGRHGLRVVDEWITKSGEEGVFLCRRQ